MNPEKILKGLKIGLKASGGMPPMKSLTGVIFMATGCWKMLF